VGALVSIHSRNPAPENSHRGVSEISAQTGTAS
jgi:hypothetical protein